MEPEVSVEQGSGTALTSWLTHGFAFLLGWIISPDRTPKKRLAEDGIKYLLEVVKEWRPVGCTSESECEMALQNYLQGRFSRDRLLVDSQVGAKHSRIDLVVENDYGIEIKFELDDESEVKRLIGQVEEMRGHFKGVLVVACGDLRPELEVRLEREFEFVEEEYSGGPWRSRAQVAFARVPVVNQSQ